MSHGCKASKRLFPSLQWAFLDEFIPVTQWGLDFKHLLLSTSKLPPAWPCCLWGKGARCTPDYLWLIVQFHSGNIPGRLMAVLMQNIHQPSAIFRVNLSGWLLWWLLTFSTSWCSIKGLFLCLSLRLIHCMGASPFSVQFKDSGWSCELWQLIEATFVRNPHLETSIPAPLQ